MKGEATSAGRLILFAVRVADGVCGNVVIMTVELKIGVR